MADPEHSPGNIDGDGAADSEAPDRARETPGGPYFGRLLIVLFAAVAFCAFMTWLLTTLMMK